MVEGGEDGSHAVQKKILCAFDGFFGKQPFGTAVVVKVDKSRGGVKPMGIKDLRPFGDRNVLRPANINDGIVTHDERAVPNDAVTHDELCVYNCF